MITVERLRGAVGRPMKQVTGGKGYCGWWIAGTRLARPIITLLSITLLTGQWGCALAPKDSSPPHFPPSLLSEEVREDLGAIGVVSVDVVPEAHLEAPTSGKGSGAGKGAATGFFSMIAAGLQSGDGYGAALGIALAPVVALGGAVYGAVAAESAATVEESEAALQNALANLRIQEALRDRVLQVAKQQTRHHFVLLASAFDEEVSYSSLAGEGIDTIIELSAPMLAIGLFSGKGINPPLPLFLGACTRLVRVADGAELYSSGWVYRSRTRKFVEWAANNAQPFRDELDRAVLSLAETVVDEMFLQYPLPGRREGWPWLVCNQGHNP